MTVNVRTVYHRISTTTITCRRGSACCCAAAATAAANEKVGVTGDLLMLSEAGRAVVACSQFVRLLCLLSVLLLIARTVTEEHRERARLTLPL